MNKVWVVVIAVGAATFAIKALGPGLLAGRTLPAPLTAVLGCLGPALLAALVVTNCFAAGRSLVLDARAAGVAAGLVAVLLRAPLLVVIVVAAAVTAGVRAFS